LRSSCAAPSAAAPEPYRYTAKPTTLCEGGTPAGRRRRATRCSSACAKRRSAQPEAISASAVGDIVAKHAVGAGVREDRRTAHALRHTFCTMLAERGVALDVIRELAGHVDVRTTQIYVDVTDQRKNDGIAALERRSHPLAG
jgi:site-specific recombinase XerD